MIHWLSFANHGGMVIDADDFAHACRLARDSGAPMDTEIVGGCIEPLDGEPADARDAWCRRPENQKRLLGAAEIEAVFGPLVADEGVRDLIDAPGAIHLDSIEDHRA